MNGTMTLLSDSGKGSEFVVSIPSKVSDSRPPKRTGRFSRNEVASAASLNILVAEDNLVNQKLIATLLNRAGHSVTIANNGREAIDLHCQGHFDLILMDVHMPELDGEQATKLIREGERSPTIPIIAVTANAIVGERERLLNLGMDGYISKPINSKELLAVVRDVGLTSSEVASELSLPQDPI
jgi:CheY-like chemotaxis protein